MTRVRPPPLWLPSDALLSLRQLVDVNQDGFSPFEPLYRFVPPSRTFTPPLLVLFPLLLGLTVFEMAYFPFALCNIGPTPIPFDLLIFLTCRSFLLVI